MQIEFVSVSTAFTKTAKGGYSTAQVQYVNERGETKSWKLMSFGNPKVYDTMKNAQPGQMYEIVTRKNDKDFTEWASAELVTGESMKKDAAAPKSPVVSQYETRDERNLRQRLIVRQSCLAQSLVYNKDATIEEILPVAEQFVAWVFEAPELFTPNEE